jgi:hypothetical protein
MPITAAGLSGALTQFPFSSQQGEPIADAKVAIKLESNQKGRMFLVGGWFVSVLDCWFASLLVCWMVGWLVDWRDGW